MSFIRNYIERLSQNGTSFLQEIPLLLERRFLFDNLSKMEPKKEKRFNDFVELIRLHMPKLVKESFTPEHLIPKQNMSSWDEFILSPFEPKDILYKEVDSLSKDFIEKTKQNKINKENFNKFKEKIIEFLEVGSIKAGLNTALANIWGLLRVIPILVKNQTGEFIEKAKFISILKGKNTQTLLRKIMSMNIFAMNGLFNILHQQPVSTKEKALQTLYRFMPAQILTSLSFFTQYTTLFNPENFSISDNGVSFNNSGRLYFEAAEELLNLEKAEGCPALRAGPEVMNGLFKMVEDMINLIPDDKYEELIKAPNIEEEEILDEISYVHKQEKRNLLSEMFRQILGDDIIN